MFSTINDSPTSTMLGLELALLGLLVYYYCKIKDKKILKLKYSFIKKENNNDKRNYFN